MPLRSLNSPLLKWPDRAAVFDATRAWASRAGAVVPELQRVGVFGSYSRGDWGVGSDLDLIAIVAHSASRPHERAAAWETTSLPVPVDLLVYTPEEWSSLTAGESRFARVARDEVSWIWARDSATPTHRLP